jgi:hypothetical protein
MFGFGKKEYVEVKGQVMRIGMISASENNQACVILLEGNNQSYISRLCGAGEDVVALTQVGDMIEFKTEKGYLNIVPRSFVNKTLNKKGYQPHPWR